MNRGTVGAGSAPNFLEGTAEGCFGLAEERVAGNLTERDDGKPDAGLFQISHLGVRLDQNSRYGDFLFA